ncbi:MAG: regulator [Candidatus Hydrogenedentes bacterium]|nr:regulator [Candidatus Hydrogenedentota bacterium]
MVIFTLLCASSGALGANAQLTAIQDVPFAQEFHEAYPFETGAAANDVRAVAVDAKQNLWAATKGGVYVLRSGKWSLQSGVTTGPVYDLLVDEKDNVWAGAWDGVYCVTDGVARKESDVTGTTSVVGNGPEGLVAMGPEGSWRRTGQKWKPIENKGSRGVRAVARVGRDDLYIGTGVGLYLWTPQALRHFYKEEDLYSGDIRALAIDPKGQLWIGAMGGIDVYSDQTYRAHYGPNEGLPNSDVRALAFDSDGVLWAGTALGVARFDGRTWSLRHGKRWLLSDDVRDITFGKDGTAWIATGGGVSAIKRRTMTLEDKAAYFLDICYKRHIRPPYLVEKCWFSDPKNTSKWEPLDDDNDGTFTAMYMAMESYRWAVTKDPAAKEHADKACEALEFLQHVTGVEGFFARTVVPSTWTKMNDANHVMSPEEYAERRVRDPRAKRVDERWRLSNDGKWLWKGDTSSDEMVGQMFGFYLYHELAADPQQKSRVATHVRKIVDYIIDGGYVLRDLDGKATRWGVWAPEQINNDPDWRVEGVNKTFEVLSFLKATYHMTGDEKYQREFLKLINKYGYAEIARNPKSYGRSERTHIQDDLLALSTPGLLLSETDPQRRALFVEGATWAYRTIEHDNNPFFNFVFGLVGGKDFHAEESVAFLRDHPLDLRHWAIDNSVREDIQLVRRPMLSPMQTSRILPPSERGVMRWDKNPWDVISGDVPDPEGRYESSGVFWLLPYWMGRYYGFIAAPH